MTVAVKTTEFYELRAEMRDAAQAFASDPSEKNFAWVLDVARRLLLLNRI